MKYLLAFSMLFSFSVNFGQVTTNKIVVDQFGYREKAKKVAVLRNPQTGADATESYSPGSSFSILNSTTKEVVYTGTPEIWSGGSVDVSSGDKAWHFEFTSVESPGNYYVLDVQNQVKSYDFEIKNDVYNEVLKHAVRAFFYQRSGFTKEAQYAGSNWADGASHVGPLQDKNCRKWDQPNDASTEKDVPGGWYDAGDYNKYTTWTANYIVELLRAYRENPSVWMDDYNIPESGNGTPDIIDETKWGVDHLLRLQWQDGSLISVVSEAGASPPSAATAASLYGGVNTSSTLSASGAYALSAIVFGALGDQVYADSLKSSAIQAWNWSVKNPSVLWKNNDQASGTTGVAAGQQEVDDYGRLKYKLRAALYLYELTGESEYKTYFESNYDQLHMMQWNYVYPFEDEEQDILLEYTKLTGASSSVKSAILVDFATGIDKVDNFGSYVSKVDPYNAHIKDYTWGSSRQKCSQGLSFWEVDYYGVNSSNSSLAWEAAEQYIHYMHGVNPMNLVYLTNMGTHGAENSVNTIYHTWFHDGTDWDDVKTSTYGPAPGIVPGGANPGYSTDACCPGGCGSTANNNKCTAVDISTLLNQPSQKSYLEFNNSWPLNSWSVTENSMGYQVEYIRLLSKFVSQGSVTSSQALSKSAFGFKVFPNPSNNMIEFSNLSSNVIFIMDQSGKLVKKAVVKGPLSIEELASGMYFIRNGEQVVKFHKL